MENRRKIWLIVLAGLAVFYVALRFWRLTDSCLWFDEIFGVHAAEMEFSETLLFIARDLIHPPLFYILLKFWIFIGGETVFWLRLFPVLFSILALIPFYLLCRRLKLSFPAIAVALLFFATNGALIKYAQEVRMYSLLLFFSLFSMWFFSRFLQLGKNIWLLTICNVLLIYTHYFGWLVVLSEIIAIIILQRIKWRQILMMFGICLLSFAPWIFTVFRASQINSDLSQNIGWIPKPNLRVIFDFVFDLVEPFYFQTSNIEPASILFISLPILILIAAAKIFFLVGYFNEDGEQKAYFNMLAIFTAAPILIALVLSWIFPVSIFGTRHLIIVFAPVAILTGVFFDEVKPQISKIVLLAALFAVFAVAFVLEINRPKQQFIWCGWENLAAALQSENAVNIYTFEDLTAYHFWFALRDSDRNFRVFKVNNVAGLTEDKAYFLPRGFEAVKTINFDQIKDERFFVAFRDTDFDLQKPPLKNFIEKGWKIGEPKVFEAQGLKAFLIEMRR